MIGRALNGRYALGEILGVGGMATVYRGVDRQLGRPVAVKVLNGGLADDPRFAERFSQEAQHAALLVHPRVVTVFDSGVDQGSPYIVMELVNGRSLSRVLYETGPLPVERAVGIAAAVCEALEVAHQQGLVHRDIKPGNIMITDDGGVKVVDFGIARASSSSSNLTQTATVLGTAAYLSPEQATAAEVDARTDLYALGCVIVEMLTGAAPFSADTPVAIAFKHVTEQPMPVSTTRPDVPPALDAVVLRLMAKNPDDRPADAAQARGELLAAVPVAGATDRTSQLLGGATQVLPPAGAMLFDGGQRTSVLPSGPLLPPMREISEPIGGTSEPERGRNPLAVLGIGVAAIVVVGGVAAFALSSSSGSGTKPQAAHSTAPADATPSASTPSPTDSGPSAAVSPAPPVSKIGPAVAITQLRAIVAQTPIKDRDRQNELLQLLDAANQAVADQRPDDANASLRDAQKAIGDMNKHHAIDGGTAQNWRGRINAIMTVLHGQAQQDNG